MSAGNGTAAVELTENSGRALKLQTDAPHLVSMGGDRLSTAVTLHPIPQGHVTLGSGPGVDIPVHGTGVLPLHCRIENMDSMVTIHPIAGNLSVDGVLVIGPTRLSQGAMLTIGRSNYMRFNHPAEAKLMKSALPNSRISMAQITFENDPSYQPAKYTKKPPVVPRKSPRSSVSDDEPSQPPSNIMTKVSKFEYLAAQNFKKSISPKVFSSNLVTVNTPARDVLGKAPPDLHNFAKNISQPAVNYSDASYVVDKQKNNKTTDRQIFGCKSLSTTPAYVNVTLNETKTINNRVVIFENGCGTTKLQNDQPHELNNMTRNINKNVNVNKNATIGWNPAIYPKAAVVTNNVNFAEQQQLQQQQLSPEAENLEDLAYRKNEAELRRNQAQVDRIKEQEIEKAEQARLEEILNMCAEYDRQIQNEKCNKPTPNRIKTNGSLPRDKRTCISPNLLNSPGCSPCPTKENHHVFQFEHLLPKPNNNNVNRSYENVSPHNHNNQFVYESVEKPASSVDGKNCVSAYENVVAVPIQQSPRTRIRTFVTTNREKDTSDIIESKFASATIEHNLHLLKQTGSEQDSKSNIEISSTPKYKSKTLPPKFILPTEFRKDGGGGYAKHLENYENLTLNNYGGSLSNDLNLGCDEVLTSKPKTDELREEKKAKLALIACLKRQMAEMENHGEELSRELELERALIIGEYKSKQLELEKLINRKEKLQKRAQKIDEKMSESQLVQEEDQKVSKEKLQSAQENLVRVERKLAELEKGSVSYASTFEELLLAQETLDNERKTFEDLEFHHLEEEADWLASREELQREIVELSKTIDELARQIDSLEKERSAATDSNVDEYAKIEERRRRYTEEIEEARRQLRTIDSRLVGLASNKETDDDDASSDGERDKITDLSCSMYVVSGGKMSEEDFNMSQSFNEKMLQEKSILDIGLGRKIPSQDDIDRISKVTIDAPISIGDGRGSLGKKTIESLKEIERNRQMHLVQQGSQVIENERRRVLALKQKVQSEVRTKWAAQRKNDPDTKEDGRQIRAMDDVENEGGREAIRNEINDALSVQPRTESEDAESPRPLSETSDVSVEVGGTLGKRRARTGADKHRPLTRYLPIRSSELDLRQHIESAGHQADLCPHVRINTTSCHGFLHKRGSKLNGWSRRWFVFDRVKRTLVYYSDKSEKKARGGAYFQAIEEVYLDHANSVKSPNPQLTFVVKTHERYYYLMAPSPEAMRIWIDVIFTGAEGYQEFEHGT